MQVVTVSLHDLQTMLDRSTERVIQALQERTQKAAETEQWFDISELCQYLPDKPAKTTVYGWVHIGFIPHHKGGKKLRFLKSEIDVWLKEGRVKTTAELSSEAQNYLNSKNQNRKQNKRRLA